MHFQNTISMMDMCMCVLHEDPHDESMQHGFIFTNELCIITLASNFSGYVPVYVKSLCDP